MIGIFVKVFKNMTISNCSFLSVGPKSMKFNQRPSFRINIIGLSSGDTYFLPLSRALRVLCLSHASLVLAFFPRKIHPGWLY